MNLISGGFMSVSIAWYALLKRILPFMIVSAALFGCSSSNRPEKPEPRPELSDLALTEIHYHPLDEGIVDGDEYEFVELKNRGDSLIDLTDVAFNDGIDYAFPAQTSLKPDSFIVLAANSAEFVKRYGFSPFGVYAGKLSNAGEKISLADMRADKKFLSIEYGDNTPWPASADGVGFSLVPRTRDLTGDPKLPSFWRTSFKIHGSSGKDDPDIVYINEALTHTDPPQSDAIELYNPNAVSVDISGWFLTDSKVNPVKFRIPAGTVVPAKGYVVFDESDFNANPTSPLCFTLNAHGEEVYVSADSTGYRKGYCHGFSFGEIENGISFDRYVTSTGEEHFVRQKQLTLDAINAGPEIGPLVISEIMYNPKNNRDEYIEIKNISTQTVALSDVKYPKNTWKIDGAGFAFPENSSIQSNEVILVISNAISIEEFRQLYAVPSTVQIFTKAIDLSNSNDTITLMKPEDPYIDSSVSLTSIIVPYMEIDKIAYADNAPWPTDADGQGSSLERKQITEYGNDPKNWKAADPTPGVIRKRDR